MKRILRFPDVVVLALFLYAAWLAFSHHYQAPHSTVFANGLDYYAKDNAALTEALFRMDKWLCSQGFHPMDDLSDPIAAVTGGKSGFRASDATPTLDGLWYDRRFKNGNVTVQLRMLREPVLHLMASYWIDARGEKAFQKLNAEAHAFAEQALNFAKTLPGGKIPASSR